MFHWESTKSLKIGVCDWVRMLNHCGMRKQIRPKKFWKRRSGGWNLGCLRSKVRYIKICLDITPRRFRVSWPANLHDNFVAKVMTQFSMLRMAINFGTWPQNVCAKSMWGATLTWLPQDIKCKWTIWGGMNPWIAGDPRSRMVLREFIFSNFLKGFFIDLVGMYQ